MAATNTCTWNSSSSALVITLIPPGKEGASKGSASVALSCTQASYAKKAVDGGTNSWGSDGTGFTPWNYVGPAFGANNTVINVTPKYKDSNGVWQKYTTAPTQSGNTYTFADPITVQGGGSAGDTSIVISMIEPGGGGLSL